MKNSQQSNGNNITDSATGNTGAAKPRRRFGISAIFDRKTNTLVELPEDIKIYNRNEKTWMGGTDDGEVYVHIERITADQAEMPTILAEGDLDMFLCSTSDIEQQNGGIRGVNVSGSIGGTEVKGYLAQINILRKMGYLVLAACRNSTTAPAKIQQLALRLIASITSNYGKGA